MTFIPIRRQIVDPKDGAILAWNERCPVCGVQPWKVKGNVLVCRVCKRWSKGLPIGRIDLRFNPLKDDDDDLWWPCGHNHIDVCPRDDCQRNRESGS